METQSFIQTETVEFKKGAKFKNQHPKKCKQKFYMIKKNDANSRKLIKKKKKTIKLSEMKTKYFIKKIILNKKILTKLLKIVKSSELTNRGTLFKNF